eukprot:Sspe_Gene.30593::Locus_15124_Transcript_1_1_Confidence_1.000_Length_1549::g.30593::m.30593
MTSPQRWMRRRRRSLELLKGLDAKGLEVFLCDNTLRKVLLQLRRVLTQQTRPLLLDDTTTLHLPLLVNIVSLKLVEPFHLSLATSLLQQPLHLFVVLRPLAVPLCLFHLFDAVVLGELLHHLPAELELLLRFGFLLLRLELLLVLVGLEHEEAVPDPLLHLLASTLTLLLRHELHLVVGDEPLHLLLTRPLLLYRPRLLVEPLLDCSLFFLGRTHPLFLPPSLLLHELYNLPVLLLPALLLESLELLTLLKVLLDELLCLVLLFVFRQPFVFVLLFDLRHDLVDHLLLHEVRLISCKAGKVTVMHLLLENLPLLLQVLFPRRLLLETCLISLPSDGLHGLVLPCLFLLLFNFASFSIKNLCFPLLVHVCRLQLLLQVTDLRCLLPYELDSLGLAQLVVLSCCKLLGQCLLTLLVPHAVPRFDLSLQHRLLLLLLIADSPQPCLPPHAIHALLRVNVPLENLAACSVTRHLVWCRLRGQ